MTGSNAPHRPDLRIALRGVDDSKQLAAAHHAALKRLGVTEIHRKSYAPVRALIPMGV